MFNFWKKRGTSTFPPMVVTVDLSPLLKPSRGELIVNKYYMAVNCMDNENVNVDEDDSDHQVNGNDLRSEV